MHGVQLRRHVAGVTVGRALAIAAAVGGCKQAPDAVETLDVRPFAESPAPMSDASYVALADAETACVIQRFEHRVLCMGPDGGRRVALGHRGEGPGEFLAPARIFRQSRGKVAVFDGKLDRVTIIEPAGRVVSEIPIQQPEFFWINAMQGSLAFGFGGSLPRSDGLPEAWNQVLDLTSGEVVWRRSVYDTAATECGRVGTVHPHPAGGYVLHACDAYLVFLEDLDSNDGRVVKSPAYREALPNERDVDAYLYDLARLGGGSALPRSAMEPYAASFREEPKSWFNGPDMFGFDRENRLWVATTRDRDAYSYFDVWVGTEYVASVRIRDRLMGFDMLDSTLVALVERQPDVSGIAARAIDWYDLAGVEWPSVLK